MPVQEKVFDPARRSRPFVSAAKCSKIFMCSSGKSSPTAPRMRTGAKKLAAAAKYVHEPPRTLSARPVGVMIVSIPMLPVTIKLIACSVQ